MEKGLVSIIVPVYNGEEYIERCVGSLISQTYENIEILVVNDGSTDNTESICNKLAASDKRIKLTTKVNEGVSVARNTAIALAQGEFITFVDADDWISIDLVEKLLNAINQDESYDIAVCGYFEVSSKNIVSKPPFVKPAKTIKEVLSQNTPAFSWAKLYRATLKEYMNYTAGISMGEDTAMIIPLFSYARNFVTIDEPLYFYYQNEASVTHNKSDTKKMFSYVRGCYLAVKNCNPSYAKEVAFTMADRIVSNEGWFLKTCLADTVEFVSENMMEFFENNSLVKSNPRLSRILTYPKLKTIPKFLYYDNFGKKEQDEIASVCLDSWKRHAPNMQIICLDEDNCDITAAPKFLQEQYNRGSMKEIANYFKLKAIYETGGVAVSQNMYFNCGIGAIRMDNSFFALRNRYDFQDDIFGAAAGAPVISKLLDSYADDGIYGDQNIPFVQRLREHLVEGYGYSSAGWTVHLDNNNITVYKCDVLSYNVTKDNVAQIMNGDQIKFLDTEYVLTEKAVFNYWNEDKNLFWAEKERLKKGGSPKTPVSSYQNPDAVIRDLQRELEGMYASKSWRITAPLRALFRPFKKIRRKK